MADLIQVLENCQLTYNLTNHSISVIEVETGRERLKILSIPDTPADFNIEENDDHAFIVNNPNGFDFIPMYDNYDNAKELGYE